MLILVAEMKELRFLSPESLRESLKKGQVDTLALFCNREICNGTELLFSLLMIQTTDTCGAQSPGEGTTEHAPIEDTAGSSVSCEDASDTRAREKHIKGQYHRLIKLYNDIGILHGSGPLAS